MRIAVAALAWIALAGGPARSHQASASATAPAHQYFSGTVTTLEESSITVTRTVLGKQDAVRRFVVTPDTRMEGKLKVNARVTVQYVESDDGDRALHIVVRTAAKK